ncbi:hypothetical protein niasHS_001545 [Heterodera schachtii]|uniref:Uncharacterized protein n=1 Tax=Heterodera schachtii TaxID=97005 RepID=A0ABD2KDR9_HETSC
MCHRRNWHSLRPPGAAAGLPAGLPTIGMLMMPSSAVLVLFWLTAATASQPQSLYYSIDSLSAVPSAGGDNAAPQRRRHQIQWHNPWGDELGPFRIRQKRVHDKGIGTAKRKRNGDTSKSDDGRTTSGGKNGTAAPGELSADWRWPSAEKAVPLEELPVVGPRAELAFRANQTQMHVRTATWLLRPNQCMEAHFRVEGKRTRLLMYTCHMAEGGNCVLDKFLATTTLKQFFDSANPSPLDSCHKLQPWMSSSAPFSFHFRFLRRPRKFADRAKELRHRQRRHGRHATREVGRIELRGFRTCESACGTEEKGGQLDDVQLAGADYFADPLEGWKRRKR